MYSWLPNKRRVWNNGIGWTFRLKLINIGDWINVLSGKFQKYNGNRGSMYTHSKKYSTSYYETLCKWGDFERAKTTLKMLLASWFFVCFFKRLRSFNAKNLGSVGQRAANLPAIKLWEWFDPVWSRTRADRFECGRGWKADFFFRPPTLIVSNFEAL